MKRIFKTCFLFISCSLFLPFTSCEDDSAEGPTSEREEIIEMLSGSEGKSWTLLSAVTGGFDVSQLMAACERDNIYRLYPNGEGEYRSGEAKCDENEPEIIETGTWELSDDLDTLALTIGIISNESKILELNEDRLQIEFTYQNQQAVATFVAED